MTDPSVTPNPNAMQLPAAPVSQPDSGAPTNLPVQGAPPGSSVLAGFPRNDAAPDLASQFLQIWLPHVGAIQQNSVAAQNAKAAEQQKAVTAAQPVINRPPATAGMGDGDGGAGAPPGSFGSKLAGALGDAAHASDTKGGWLSGVVNTLNARNSRIAKENNDAILQAKSNAETVALHHSLHRQDLEDQQQFVDSNQRFFNQYKESNDQESGLSYGEIQDRAKKDPKFLQDYTVKATGLAPVTDKDGTQKKVDGIPVTEQTFTVMKNASKDGSDVSKTIDAGESAEYNKLLGMNFPVGTKLTMAQDNALSLKLEAARNTTNILAKMNGGRELAPEVVSSIRPLLDDPTVRRALTDVPGEPYAGIVQHLQNADAHIAQGKQMVQTGMQQKNQQMADAGNKLIADASEEKQKLDTIRDQAIPQKTIEDYNKKQGESNAGVAEYLNDPSKIQGHSESVVAMADDIIRSSKDPAVVSQAQRVKSIAQNVQAAEDQRKVNLGVAEQSAKEKAAKIDNNPNGLSGAAYIATLPPGRANLVRAIAEGRLPVNPNAFERSTAGKPNALADDMYAAYPDFNATLGAEWPKAWTNYMISGQDHKKALAYNTALLHMQNLYDHTTVKGLIPGTQDYNDRQVDLNNFGREVGNALAQGVLTQSEADEIHKSLDSMTALTPEMKRERVKETAKLLYGKIKSQQDQFDAVSPSAAIKAPSLLLPDSKKSLDYVLTDGGKLNQTPSQSQPQGHKVGDTIMQNGHQYKVTGVDASGKVTGAE